MGNFSVVSLLNSVSDIWPTFVHTAIYTQVDSDLSREVSRWLTKTIHLIGASLLNDRKTPHKKMIVLEGGKC